MDLLLLSDKIGGGVARPRFVKPGRRDRGTELDGVGGPLSDTFLSSMGSRMFLPTAADAPVTKRVNVAVTHTSGDANALFVVEAGQPGFQEASADKRKAAAASAASNAAPQKSARTLYNARVEKDLVKCAGRAGVDHIGMGSSVLIDCTPRSARMQADRGGNTYLRLTRKQVYLGMQAVQLQVPGPGGAGEAKVAITPADVLAASAALNGTARRTGTARSDFLASVPELSTGRGGGALGDGAFTGRVTGRSSVLEATTTRRGTGLPPGSKGHGGGGGGSFSARAVDDIAAEKARLGEEVRRVERQLERLEASLERSQRTERQQSAR